MQQMNSIVPQTLNSLGIRKKYQSQCVLLYWKDIVGEEISTHAWPVQVERGVLTVFSSNSVWMNHLFLLKNDIISKINTYMEAAVISDIRFRAGNRNRQLTDEGKLEQLPLFLRLKTVKLTKEEVIAARNLVTEIQDIRLRKKILSLLYKNKAYTKLKEQEGWQPCKKCQVLCPPEDKRCMACEVEDKSLLIAAIMAIIRQAPWQKYNECNQQIKCSLNDYIQARQQLMSRLIETIRKGQADGTDKTALAMMATGLSPLELTDNMVEQQIAKFRRKTNVSTPRR